MKSLLIAILLILTMLGVSMEMAKAEGKESYRDTDVVCATLGYNAGYDEKGAYYAELVDPYYKGNEQAIKNLSYQVVSELAEHALMTDKTLTYVAREVFNKYCNRPFI